MFFILILLFITTTISVGNLVRLSQIRDSQLSLITDVTNLKVNVFETTLSISIQVVMLCFNLRFYGKSVSSFKAPYHAC